MALRNILLTTCLTALPALAQAADQSNILLIIADDMGLDASSCYAVGNQQAKMPNIQAMCDGGLVFENAYSAPVCSPTRATIMTGQYGFRTGVGAAIPPDGTNGLSADETSLFDVLESSDYSANLIGKWHLAGAGAGLNHPEELDVPAYWGVFKGGVRDYYLWDAVAKGAEVKVEEYATTAITDRALHWIGAQDAPWFLWLAYNAPHTPFHLPPDALHSAGDLPTDEDSISDNPLPYYNAMLEALDAEIGRLFEGVDDDTIVMFIGDNGSPNQVVGDMYGGHKAKGTIYEGGTHVPLVVTGPGIEPGRTGAFMETVDLFTTVASLTGADAPAVDGQDFSPVLTGGETTRDVIYVEHFGDAEDAKPSDVFGWALREGDYKLVAETGAEPELYDLAADPLETVDLLADGVSDAEATLLTRLENRAAEIRAE